MRRALLIVSLCACNRVFGLDPTQAIDAPPPDAPFACPPPGEPLRFALMLRQVIYQDCGDYNLAPDANLAMAVCYVPGPVWLAEGPIDGVLVPAPGLPPVYETELQAWGRPRPLPDGSAVILRSNRNVGPTLITSHVEYIRAAGGWAVAKTLPFGNTAADTISNVARHPKGFQLLVVHDRDLGGELEEWVFDGTSWARERSFSPSELGLRSLTEVALTVDGLRLVGIGSFPPATPDVMVYAARTAPDQPFGSAIVLDDVPLPTDRETTVYLTEDCGRLYLTGLESVFYLQQ